MKRVNNTIYDLLDSKTDELVTFSKVTVYADGTDMTDDKCDGVIYRKLGSEYFKRNFTGAVNVKWFGAVGNGITDDTLAIQKALIYDSIIFDNGIYLISNILFPANKTVHFINGGRILVRENQQVTFSSSIIASQDSWIFDCEDLPTNYSNQETPIFTKIPLVFNILTEKNNNKTSAISVKWFGATGAGFDSDVVPAFYETNVVNPAKYIDDTKSIRFALTAISNSLEMTEGSFSYAYGGSNTLYFPKGCYCVNETLYVSGGCFLKGDGALPSGGTLIIQMNPSKDLFVLQSKGVGGLGGGGSSHILRELIIGVRPNNISNPNSAVIKFEDNKFNLDSRFYDLRFSNCPFNGSFIAVDKKNGRYPNGGIGVGTTVGMWLSLHIYNSMLDVGAGDFIRVGESATAFVRIYNMQAFDLYGSFLKISEKIESDLITNDNSVFEIVGCNFEGVSVINIPEPAKIIQCSDRLTKIFISDSKFESQIVENRLLGGSISINKAKLFSFKNNYVRNRPEFALPGGYFFQTDGRIETLIISDNVLKKDNEGSFQSIFFSENFECDYLQIFNNMFIMPTRKQTHIFFNNPAASVKSGAIKGNIFDALDDYDAIFGNPNPNIIIEGNIFKSPQAFKNNSYKNIGMLGRTEIYLTSIPVTGTYGVGDRVINSNPSVGQPKSWVCTVAGSPGTFVSEGNL